MIKIFFITTIVFIIVSMPGKKTNRKKARRVVGLVDAVVGWRDLASNLLGNHPKVYDGLYVMI